MLAIEHDQLWKDDASSTKRVGITIIQEKNDEEMNKKLKIKAFEIMSLFKGKKDIIVEGSFQINKFEKQIQYFDKVRICICL